MKYVLSAGIAFAVLSGCATAPVETTEEVAVVTETKVEETVGAVEVAPIVTVEKSSFELAMESVDTLVANGGEQVAINRLTQLLGDPNVSADEKKTALFRRGTIRMSERGFDTLGAVDDFQEIISRFGAGEFDGAAASNLDVANGKATSLRSLVEQPSTSRLDKFRALFDLGDHQEAVDLMLATNLNPGNDYLVAMYQIGWLCEGEGFTGPVYAATEPDGTGRNLQFCDFGK